MASSSGLAAMADASSTDAALVAQTSRRARDAASATPPRGAFIVLEGLDRSGKTTQAALLAQRFKKQGWPVQTMRFPDRSTPIGKMIDTYLKDGAEMEDHVIHLLFSANRWEAADRIRNLLASGTSVICDRYYHSGIVYSAAKQNPRLSLTWARAPERGLPRPDIVLFLDLEEEQARARGGWGSEVYEKAELQRRVRELFWELSMSGHDRQGETLLRTVGGLDAAAWRHEEEDLVVMDASSSIEQLAEAIWAKVRDRFHQVHGGEIGRTVRAVV